MFAYWVELCLPRTSEYVLVWKQGLCKFNQANMISYSIRMGPNPMTSVLKDEGNLKTDMGEDIAL